MELRRTGDTSDAHRQRGFMNEDTNGGDVNEAWFIE